MSTSKGGSINLWQTTCFVSWISNKQATESKLAKQEVIRTEK